MSYQWLDQYCCSKKGVVKDYKTEWEALRYLIGGKMFLLQGENREKRQIITVKCEPMFGKGLREEYSDIIPGYYMNKKHWNSIYMDGKVPSEVLRGMIDMSYELVLNSLTKKKIREILNGR